ncbi:hypothetical protein N802_05115 [Knoellia sinensis KCTC 19936]|uniref:DUF4328 domain-containing protein n=2 Tax=Knoellia TaxID=136099 RepID=A0A0A0J0T0_9MICO|nr:hypothetical protein N802_05115 [Knoellia sinensis KCTC 19936]
MATLAMGGLALLLTIALAATSFAAANDYQEAIDATGTSADTLTAYDLLALPWTIAMLIAWVLTAVWLGKARANTQNIRPGFHFRRSQVWDTLGWIVPFVSLWFPRQILGDLSKGSSPAMKDNRQVGIWWTAWLVGLVASQASDRVAMSGDGSGVGLLPVFNVVHAVAWAIAFALWAKLVLSIVRDQENATPRA